jgi:hypothetical protein
MADSVQLSNFPDLSVEDTVSLEITPAADPTLTEFALETDAAVTWWKALELHGPNDGIIRQVETQDANHGPNTIAASATDLRGARLVLAKAKIFGIHAGMYELRDLDEQLGNRLGFIWQRDEDRDGPVAGFFRDLGRGVDIAANAAADAVEAVVNAVADAIADVIEGIGALIAGVLDWIGGLLGQIPVIGPLLKGIFHWVSTIVSAAFDFVATAIKAVINLVSDFIGGIVRIVGGALGGLLAWDAGRARDSVLRGLGDIGAGIAGAVIIIVAKVVAFVQSVFVLQFGERPLTNDETALLRRVYRGSVAYANIRVIEGFVGLFSVNPRAFTLAEEIYLKDHDPALEPDVLVHECGHVWQYQHTGSRYVTDALVGQASRSGYSWQAELAAGAVKWQQFNDEAQAQFLQDVWLSGRETAPRTVGPGAGAIGGGVFYKDDPIGTDVEFTVGTTSHTSLAIDAITYVRSQVSFRLSQFF